MDPIVLVTRASKTPAFPDPAGAITNVENDANLNALKTASEQLDTEKLAIAAAVTLAWPAAAKAVPIDADYWVIWDTEAGGGAGAWALASRAAMLAGVSGTMTAAAIRDALETLTTTARLDASAIQNLPTVSAGAPVTITHNGAGGDPVTGDTLTAAFSAGYSGTVQWTRNAVDIGGATSATYVAQVADEGATVAARVISLIFTATGLPVAGGSATVPAAFTNLQWDAQPTAVPGEMEYQVTALPSDGGSAITALEYRVGAGAAIALTGTGIGNRTVTSGWSAGTAADTQIRAVNAIGAGAWSEPAINRTPAAAGGGAAYIASTTADGFNTITGTLPAGVTATDTLVALLWSTNSASLETLAAPSGWTAGTGTLNSSGQGARFFTAPGNVGTLTFEPTGLVRMLLIGVSGPIRAGAGFAYIDFGGPGASGANRPTPSITATAGDCVISAYMHQDDGVVTSFNSPGSPQAGYTRELLSDGATVNYSILSQEGIAAGVTGEISHDALGAFGLRVLFTGSFGP